MSYVAERLAAVKPSASMAASQAAKTLRATGVDVIDLGLGEPDFPTPGHVIAAADAAARAGETLYTAAGGTPALRAAVAEKFRRENGLDYGPDDIVVANGAKQVIFNALMATLSDGDEAILPAPYFVSYPEMVKLLGGVPVVVECPAAAGFRLTPGPIRVVLDAANLFEQEDAARANEIIDAAVELLGPDIALAHARDRHANGEFATAGQGVVDWPHCLAALRRIGFDGTLVTHGIQAAEAREVARFLSSQLDAAG